MQNRSRFIQKVKLDVGIKHTGIFRRHDLCFVKSHDLTERLEYGFIRCKHKGIVAKSLVPRILIRKQELVEDTSSHKNGFSKSHREGIDVVWIILSVFLHLFKECVGLFLGRSVKETNLTTFIESIIRCIGEAISLMTPVIEHFIDLLVVHEFLHKDIHL